MALGALSPGAPGSGRSLDTQGLGPFPLSRCAPVPGGPFVSCGSVAPAHMISEPSRRKAPSGSPSQTQRPRLQGSLLAQDKPSDSPPAGYKRSRGKGSFAPCQGEGPHAHDTRAPSTALSNKGARGRPPLHGCVRPLPVNNPARKLSQQHRSHVPGAVSGAVRNPTAWVGVPGPVARPPPAEVRGDPLGRTCLAASRRPRELEPLRGPV